MALKNKTIFITGGAGFIGSNLAGLLVEDNQIVLFDNLTRNSLKDRSFSEHPHIKLVQGDILDFAAMQEVVSAVKPTHAIHCAAVAGIDTVIRSPVTTMEVNMTGTANFLKAVNGTPDVERVVCFSTSEVFGQQAFLAGEADGAQIGTVGVARWTYAVSKLAAEHLAIAYHKEHNLPTVVLRPFNVYGPGQVGEGALSIFIKRAMQNKDIDIHGDGTQIRAWCFIDDMIQGLMKSLEHPAAVGETFNIGNQRAVTTIYGLANTVLRVLKSSSNINFIRKDYADVELRVPNVNKALEMLDFGAKVDLDEGILRTAEYLKKKELV